MNKSLLHMLRDPLLQSPRDDAERRFLFPAKTFLVGEYVAVLGGPAVLLTTTPCFEVSVVDDLMGFETIHPDSPAGLWWARQSSVDKHLGWRDPYFGLGGLGASSAQFLGAYAASCVMSQHKPSELDLLAAYYECSWHGQGMRPSGYDVLAQARRGCVYINQKQGVIQCFDWVFEDVDFILVHSGQKLKTHEHLMQIDFTEDSLRDLSIVAELVYQAFENADSRQLISAVNEYHDCLKQKHLVSPHSLECLQQLAHDPAVLAAKGCGAMGADVLLLIVARNDMPQYRQKLIAQGWKVIADSEALYSRAHFIHEHL